MTKVFILYKKEDHNDVKNSVKFISKQYLSVKFKPVAVGKYYHEIYNLIFESDLIILFWSPNSIKSRWFKIFADKIMHSKIECCSIFHNIEEDNFPPDDSHFLSINTYDYFVTERGFVTTGRRRSLFGRSKSLFATQKRSRDIVNFAVFAPHQIQVKNNFTIDIWAYLENQYDTVLKKAEEIKRDQIIGRQDSVAIKIKSVLTIRLEMNTLNVQTDFNFLYWEGKPASTSFLVTVPENSKIGKHFGTAKIYLKGICIANLIFNVNVSESKAELNYQDMEAKIKKFKKAFASYSSKDISEVYGRILGMKKIAPFLDIFLARAFLKSGERWEEAIMEHVPNKDVFFLFWSRNALKSKWVDKEWRLALKERNLSYIDPVPLESPKLATPPPELSALHFDDIWIALKHENDYIDTYPR